MSTKFTSGKYDNAVGPSDLTAKEAAACRVNGIGGYQGQTQLDEAVEQLKELTNLVAALVGLLDDKSLLPQEFLKEAVCPFDWEITDVS
jgi:hypothetical protein